MKAVTFAAMLLLGLSGPAAIAENQFGIMTHLSCPSWDVDGASRHVGLASRMSGEWGWVRQLVCADPAESAGAARFIVLCRAYKLKPILYINALARNVREPAEGRFARPRPDADGGYSEVARVVTRYLQGIQAEGVEVPYLELWNEPNLGDGWNRKPNPREYARYHVAVARAVRKVSPKTRILNAALSNSCGTDDDKDGMPGRIGDANLDNLYFTEEMLKAEPEIADLIDYWASHPYPLNHPPEYSQDRFSITGYRAEMEVFKKITGKTIPVIITESGYSLGDQADNRYPKIDEGWRVALTVRAYLDFWRKDPNLTAVCPFLLGDPLYGGEDPIWNSLVWSNPDFTPKPVLEAVAALPHEKGTDYLPSGSCSLRGRVKVQDSDALVTGALVWLVPGGYATLSGKDGRFEIAAVPAGEYALRAAASCFKAEPTTVTLSTGNAERDALVKLTGLLTGGTMEKPWQAFAEADVTTSPDSSISLSHSMGGVAPPCLELKGTTAVRNDTDYLSIRPKQKTSVRFSFRYLPKEAAGDAEASATLRAKLVPFIAHSPNPAELPVEVAVACHPGEWTTMETYIEPRDVWTQRLRVIFSAEAPSGSILLDDVMVLPVGGRNVLR